MEYPALVLAPSMAAALRSRGGRVNTYEPDILTTGLDIVFCGVNPALTAVTDGHNFSNPTNRFWRAIHSAGFTDRLLTPAEEWKLLEYGCGITAVVRRPTAQAGELSRTELRESLAPFEARMRTFTPRVLAFLGKQAISAAPGAGTVSWGRQHRRIAGAVVWVLPNPSGRNRSFTIGALVDAYAELRDCLPHLLHA
jgi:double-stranded uracil-DNA glycosylase